MAEECVEPFPLTDWSAAPDDRDPSGWIITYTGRQFWPLDPRPEDIDIRDIAHALANLCRFVGQCRPFYSVGQHSVWVADKVPDHLKLTALLHDASEAYLSDLARPVKRRIGDLYLEAEARLERVIADRFGLVYPFPPEIKEADNLAVTIERRDLFRLNPACEWTAKYRAAAAGHSRLVPWQLDTTAGVFLTAFRTYGGKS